MRVSIGILLISAASVALMFLAPLAILVALGWIN